MFPRALADGPFSLRAAPDGAPGGGAPVCCALSVGATLAPDGRLDGYEVTPSLVRVTHKLTYDEADADIALGPGAANPELQRLYEAARLRWGVVARCVCLFWGGEGQRLEEETCTEPDAPPRPGGSRIWLNHASPLSDDARRRKSWRAGRGAIDIDTPEARTEVPAGDLAAAAPAVKITRLSQWESAARVMVAGARSLGLRRGAPGQRPPRSCPSCKLLPAFKPLSPTPAARTDPTPKQR
jgi:exoribonuclease-2